MEASPPSTGPESWLEQFNTSLSHQRHRVRELLAAQQQRLQRAEAALTEQVRQVAEELACNRSDTRAAHEQVQQRSAQLVREAATLDDLRKEFEARQAQWEQLQQRARQQQEELAEQIRRQQDTLERSREELLSRQTEITAAEAKLQHDQRALELARSEHQAEQARLQAAGEKLEAQRAELDSLRQQLLERQSQTESQRRQIARELKAQRAAHLEELARRQADLERRRAALERQETDEQAKLTQHLQSAHECEAELGAELQAARQRASEFASELQAARTRDTELLGELKALRERESHSADELKRAAEHGRVLSAEAESLRSKCARLQQDLEQQRALGAAGAEQTAAELAEHDEYRKRYDMALDDLRELKDENAQLQQDLTKARIAAPAASAGGALSWEAQKQRILAALEGDMEENDPDRAAAKRLEVEEVVQTTERALAEKDREIEDLKRLLETQSSNLGAVAVGAAALGEVLDKDAVIQEERENLRRIQEEWRGKVSRAEIDLSLERARLARQRAEFEEKLRALEQQATQPAAQSGHAGDAGKPVRGRWLARLGLKDIEGEKGGR